jgi:hypothetical protein
MEGVRELKEEIEQLEKRKTNFRDNKIGKESFLVKMKARK